MSEKAADQKTAKKPARQIIPVLRTLSVVFNSLKSRLNFFDYELMEIDSPEFAALGLNTPPLVVLLPMSGRVQLSELSKAIKAFHKLYPGNNTRVLAVYSGPIPFRINELYAIGVNGMYQFPLEDELLINKIFEIIPVFKDAKELGLDELVRIHIIEIESMKSVKFDIFVFLPMNNKAILYMEKDSAMDAAHIKKFKENTHYALYVRRADVKAYQDYARDQLKAVGENTKLNELEKSKEIGSRLNGLMSSFFDEEEYSEDEGKQLLENLKAIVTDEDPSKKDITSFASEKMTTASHSHNVSAYCYMFGMAMGLGDGQSLRLGGLLHDIGISELPMEIQRNLPGNLLKEEFQKFKIHPLLARASIEKKKLHIKPEVLEMIMYHHEHTDGTGYPTGKKGSDIPKYAKVCAFANEFDKLTSIRPGHPQLTPKEAIRRIAGLDGMPASPIYDLVAHQPILDQFLRKPADKPKSTAAISAAQGVTGNPVTAAGSVSAGAVSVASATSAGAVKTNAPAAKGQGSVITVSSKVDKKNVSLSLGRLLKTDAYKPSGFVPDFETKDVYLKEMFEDFSAQVSAHFKKLYEK